MIRFLRTRNVHAPEREAGNAGFDFFVPEFDEKFVDDCKTEGEKIPQAAVVFKKDECGDYIEVAPHCRVSIPSGIKSRIELPMPLSTYGLGIDLVVENKSGIATKKGLDTAACEIDENYMGEIHLSLTNTTVVPIKIRAGDKITQIVPRVYIVGEATTVDEDSPEGQHFWDGFKYNNRGEGWAGSTGTKA